MDSPEKLGTLGTQNEEKQNKNTICAGHHYAQKNAETTLTSGGIDEANIVLCGNRSRHHNTELRT